VRSAAHDRVERRAVATATAGARAGERSAIRAAACSGRAAASA